MKYLINSTLENLIAYGSFITILNGIVYGIAAPFMISYPDNIMVVGGIFISIAMLYLDIKLVKHLINFYNGDKNEKA